MKKNENKYKKYVKIPKGNNSVYFQFMFHIPLTGIDDASSDMLEF